MKKPLVCASVSEEMLKKIDEIAEELKLSRSSAIRFLLSKALGDKSGDEV